MNTDMHILHKQISKERTRIDNEVQRLLDIKDIRPSWLIDQQLVQASENLARVDAALKELTRQ